MHGAREHLSTDDSTRLKAAQNLPYELIERDGFSIPVLLSAPHGGRDYPASIVESMRDPESKLRLEDRYVDALARLIGHLCGVSTIIAEAPRAVIDLNRSPDDVDWSMISGVTKSHPKDSLINRRARSGLGIIPRRLPGTGEIWRLAITKADLDQRIATIHRPYHQAIGATLEKIRHRWGAALLIDLHSMPPLCGSKKDQEAAKFVIGDRFGASCAGSLIAISIDGLSRSGQIVALNRPYSGGYVLDRHSMPRRQIHALQIEVCRSIYLDKKFEEPTASMFAVARALADTIGELAHRVREMGMSIENT